MRGFDPGYATEPFASLCRNYPGTDVYPPDDFRIEWGPVFHRGRLDGTARVLVIGQDPAAHEAISRRILVGEAGQRIQGFLAKLGIDTSYVMINTFLFSVYGQGGGERHKDDPAIAAYRHSWLNALIVGKRIEAVVALGRLADLAFQQWKATPEGSSVGVAYRNVIHPTYPEAVSARRIKKKSEAMKELLTNWNEGLEALRPAICRPEVDRDLVLYGEKIADHELVPIPAIDLPAGLPEWMGAIEGWARRVGGDREEKRATITVQIPKRYRPWS